FIYMVYYIDRLSYVEPSLHLWDKVYFVMVDNVLDVFLSRFANILLIVISPFPFLILLIWMLSLCLLVSLGKFHGVLRSFDLADLSIGWNFPSSVFCRAGFVDKYCLNLVLSWNILFTPSMISWTFCVMTFLILSYYLTDESVSSIIKTNINGNSSQYPDPQHHQGFSGNPQVNLVTEIDCQGNSFYIKSIIVGFTSSLDWHGFLDLSLTFPGLSDSTSSILFTFGLQMKFTIMTVIGILEALLCIAYYQDRKEEKVNKLKRQQLSSSDLLKAVTKVLMKLREKKQNKGSEQPSHRYKQDFFHLYMCEDKCFPSGNFVTSDSCFGYVSVSVIDSSWAHLQKGS
ncbi:hypothetical protein STEG23_013467, partial [Scotinomys teguina]